MMISGAPVLVADLLLEGTLVTAGAALFALCLSRASAAVRHCVWAGAFAALMLLPIIALVLPVRLIAERSVVETAASFSPAAALKNTPSPSHFIAASAAETGDVVSARPAARADHAAAFTAAPIDRETRPFIKPAARTSIASNILSSYAVFLASLARTLSGRGGYAALFLWACGALAAIVRFAAGHCGLARLTRRAATLNNEDVRALVHRTANAPIAECLLGGAETEGLSPMTWGVRRPVVLLPAGARVWSAERLRAVLAHELAHVDRRDWAVQSAAALVAALNWPNPLIWYARRRMMDESERACDDRVVTAGVPAAQYASDLLEIVRSLRGRQLAAAVPMARPSRIEGRLASLLNAGADRRPASPRTAALILLAFLAAAVPLAATDRRPDHDHSRATLSKPHRFGRAAAPRIHHVAGPQLLNRYYRYLKAKRTEPNGGLDREGLLRLGRDLDAHTRTSEARGVFNDYVARDLHTRDLLTVDTIHAGVKRAMEWLIVSPSEFETIIAGYPNAANNPYLQYEMGIYYEHMKTREMISNVYTVVDYHYNEKATAAYHRAFAMNDLDISPRAGASYIGLLAAMGRTSELDAAVAELLRRFPVSKSAADLRQTLRPVQDETPAPSTHVSTDWKVYAPGGVVVELLKVATSADGPSWRPNGTLIASASPHGNAGFKPFGKTYGLLIKITGADPTDDFPLFVKYSGVQWPPPTEIAPATEPDTHWVMQSRLIAVPRTTSFAFTVMSGPWKRVAVLPAPSRIGSSVAGGGFKLDAGWGMWRLTDSYGETQRRLMVVDRRGRSQHLKMITSSLEAKASKASFQAPQYPLSEIREIRVEARPYFHVEFRGIHLTPNAGPQPAGPAHV